MPVAPTRASLALLIETNVVLDVILMRHPWATEAVQVLDAISRGAARGFIAAHAVTTIYYIVEKERGRATAVTAVGDVLQILTVVPIGAPEFQRALAMGLPDFEDSVQAACCLVAGADYVVTRNGKDFKGAPVETRMPGEILAMFAQE